MGLGLSAHGIFNVRCYGAKGDGGPGDFAGIVAARNALNAEGGGVLFFPRGSYVMPDAIGPGAYRPVAGQGERVSWGSARGPRGTLLQYASRGARGPRACALSCSRGGPRSPASRGDRAGRTEHGLRAVRREGRGESSRAAGK